MKPLIPLLFLAASCASTGRLYDLDSGTIMVAQYTAGLPRGPITIEAADGTCSGEFSTTPNGSWGAIYSSGGSSAQAASMGLANRGAAVAVCPTGRTIECEFVASFGHGTGYCRDNRGHRYRLML